MLTIHSKNSPPNDDDVKLIEEIPLKKPCSISENTSNRVIPERQISFKPPLSSLQRPEKKKLTEKKIINRHLRVSGIQGLCTGGGFSRG